MTRPLKLHPSCLRLVAHGLEPVRGQPLRHLLAEGDQPQPCVIEDRAKQLLRFRSLQATIRDDVDADQIGWLWLGFVLVGGFRLALEGPEVASGRG